MSDKKKIIFNYIKANNFRVIHVDGGIGGFTPTGDIFLSLYSQRQPIPQVTVQEVREDNTLGDELISERVGRAGLVREVEVGVAMRLEVAEEIAKWLNERISELKLLKSEGVQQR